MAVTIEIPLPDLVGTYESTLSEPPAHKSALLNLDDEFASVHHLALIVSAIGTTEVRIDPELGCPAPDGCPIQSVFTFVLRDEPLTIDTVLRSGPFDGQSEMTLTIGNTNWNHLLDPDAFIQISQYIQAVSVDGIFRIIRYPAFTVTDASLIVGGIAIPEPTPMAMIGLAIAAIAFARLRRPINTGGVNGDAATQLRWRHKGG